MSCKTLRKHWLIRHCEKRSDAAIQKCLLNQCAGLPRFARNDGHIELISASLKDYDSLRAEARVESYALKAHPADEMNVFVSSVFSVPLCLCGEAFGLIHG